MKALLTVLLGLSAIGLSLGTIRADAAAQIAVPPTMQAAAIDRGGGPEVLTLHTVPVPGIGADEVLIALDTAGVASWDASIRQDPNAFDVRRPLPLILGTDGAGLIAAVGAAVQGYKVGDRVYAYSFDNPKGGFYAEYVAVAAKRVGHVPERLSLKEAGAIGTTGLTAIQGIDDALHLKPGDTVIIHGAAGGVGTLAVQFAKLRGAKVLATVSSEDGANLVRRLGADATVDGRHGDIAAAAKSFAPHGIDAVLAFAGGEALERCIDALRPGGLMAYPSGVEPAPKARDGTRIIRYDAVAGPREFERLNAAIEAAKLQVPIEAEYALADASKAHERLAAGHVLGKVILHIH
jgi:NADPH:quinone reductase-like Zn-dependent oxidoreductase